MEISLIRASRTATLLVPLTILAAVAGCGRNETPVKTSRFRGAILISIDTARADHFSCYGYAKPTSPRLDALAAKGALFERALVPIPRTTQSLASMMTGLEPRQHGVRRLDQSLDAKFTTLAEKLDAAGFKTGAHVEIPYFLPSPKGGIDGQGLEQGFAPRYFDEPGVEYRADRITDNALAWLEKNLTKNPDLRFFLWIHYRDPHAPYYPPEPFKNRFDPNYKEPYDGPLPEYFHYWPVNERLERVIPPGRTVEDLQRDKEFLKFGHSPQLTPRFVERATALYDGEIAFTDDQIGRLLDGVTRLGLDDDTITVVTADHGESLGEHDFYFDHGEFLYDTCLHVPLLIHAPGYAPTRVAQLVGTIDIAPTILELLAVPPFTKVAGKSLVPLLEGKALPPSEYFAESGEPLFPEGNPRFAGRDVKRDLVDPGQRLRAWSETDRVKVIYDPVTKKTSAYDLEKDPREQTDRAGDPSLARRLEKIRAVLESISRIGAKQKLPRADIERLKLLAEQGYIAGALLEGLEESDEPEPGPEIEPPKPHDSDGH